jgi:chaperonin cofactor prefoldin
MNKKWRALLLICFAPIWGNSLFALSKYEKNFLQRQLKQKVRTLSQRIDEMTLQKEHLRRERDKATQELQEIQKNKLF